jgi:DNA transformation protein and related proteins
MVRLTVEGATMGLKGARYSDQVGEFADELVEGFETLGGVSWKKMFGGVGIFVAGSMFALIDSDAQLHLKVDDTNRGLFESAGVEQHGRMPYYAVPADVLEDDDALLEWARRSAEIATA